jgi:multicomponent Na+:H+ antiporter subunit F
MRILRYIIGFVFVLSLLCADAFFGQTMFNRWFYLFIGSCFFSMIQLAFGATNYDRFLSFKAASIALVGFCAILAVSLRKDIYIDIAIAWTLQSYMVSLFLSNYLEGGNLDD